ncbi:MAG TPA: hypothetical protein VK509_09955, partial [Polyangiales bacterium]|nr:hypothetical protein [Polyangiales bacterium]
EPEGSDPIASDDEPASEPAPANQPEREPPSGDRVDAGSAAGNAIGGDGGRDDPPNDGRGDRTYVDTNPDDASRSGCAVTARRGSSSGGSSFGTACLLAAVGLRLARRRSRR